MPRFSQIWPVRTGHDVPAKMSVLRMMVDPSEGGGVGEEEKVGGGKERKKVERGANLEGNFSPTGALSSELLV